MSRTVFARVLSILGLAAGPLFGAFAAADTLVVYSARNEQLIKPIFDAYTKDTGVEIKFATGEAAVLIERLAAEGRNSPADILMTVDAGELWNAA
jgi:iron(III) transport system substrate-binding protein